MKPILLLVHLLLMLLATGLVPVFAQHVDLARNRLQLRFIYTLQRPFTTASSSSLMCVGQTFGLRQGPGVGLRYYPLSHWSAEYQSGLSPEGGGYKQLFTNID